MPPQQPPQEPPAAGLPQGPQAAGGPLADPGHAWGPSLGGPLFAPVRDASAVAEEVRHQPAQPLAGGVPRWSPAAPIPQCS